MLKTTTETFTSFPQVLSSGSTADAKFRDRAKSRSSACPATCRRWRGQCRGGKPKCSCSMGRTSGGESRSPDVWRCFPEQVGSIMLKHSTAFVLRLDLKMQQIDRGYPRFTDQTFGGVPVDSHDVFLFKGKGSKSHCAVSCFSGDCIQVQ